jgi:hypothetical protein
MNQSIKDAFQRFWDYVVEKIDTTTSGQVDAHNKSGSAHSDIRSAVNGSMPKSGGTFTGAVKTGTASTSGYYVRNIKFSDTAETPTTEGDICFKLK